MYRASSGPSEDLETFSRERQVFSTIPNLFPRSGTQGEQISDIQNRHTESPQTIQMSGFRNTNPLPFERFVGTFRRHVNEPLLLSVNEVIPE